MRNQNMNKNKIETQTKQENLIEKMSNSAAEDMCRYGIKNPSDKKKSKLREMRFIGIEFDYRRVKIGEDLVNKAISEGFQPLRDYKTNSGLVIVMAKLEDEENQCNA